MADPQDGPEPRDPSQSNTEAAVDLSTEDEAAERREKRQSGELSVDDIQNDELREKVIEARKKHGVDEETQQKPRDTGRPTEPDPESSEEVDRVQLDKGEDPLEQVAAQADKKLGIEETDEPSADEQAVEKARQLEEDTEDVMEGVTDDDVEEAMDLELNVIDDIDPEHFDYDDQDFSVFGGYGTDVTIEYNSVYFHLAQPGDREQEKLINEMGGGADGKGMQLTEMMSAMINTTIDKPADIEDITADWTPFERMGLGMQCMEFLGLDALGNM